MAGYLLPTAASAQTPTVRKFTFHVYVDPNYGDDRLAFGDPALPTQLNPQSGATTPAARRPLADYAAADFPDGDGNNTNDGRGALQHAPCSFRTLTGGASGNGAIEYVRQVFDLGPTGAGLPFTVTVGDEVRSVEAVIIHCLPGLYGPDSSDDGSVSKPFNEATGGLRYNGERFPIMLPRGVSLQGTSALDTIFDARSNEFDPAGSDPIVFMDCRPQAGGPEQFVDSITLRNCRANQQPYVNNNLGVNRNNTGAAIYFEPDWAEYDVTISNCFFIDNDVGIAIDSDEAAVRPKIVNNTFAFNLIGIWSGYRPGTGSPVPNRGYAHPLILNNIFDTRRTDDPDHTGRIPFLGVHPDDVTVAQILDNSGFVVPGSTSVAFNAWDVRQITAAIPAGSPPNWVGPTTTPSLRAGNLMAFPAPRVNLAPFMGSATLGRGLLYVADALRLAGEPISPHDLRLAPLVVADPTTVSATTSVSTLNPLVNQGADLGTDLSRFSKIEMHSTSVGNEVELDRYPGIDVPFFTTADPDRFHGWDLDCEGFGNPRIRCRTGFPSGTFGNIDLGADEMDELIMAGYFDSTRIYGIPYVAAPVRTRVYFLNIRPPAGTLHPRPLFNATVGHGFHWWEHVRTPGVLGSCVDCVSVGGQPSNYTDAATEFPLSPPAPPHLFGSERSFSLGVISTFPRTPIMRNLPCDYAPALAPDPTPFWGPFWFGQDPALAWSGDPYGSNPWFGLCVENNPQASLHFQCNWNLYRSETHPIPLYQVHVREGTAFPPGTYTPGAFPPTTPAECGGLPEWLAPGLAQNTFGPFGSSCAGTSSGLNVGIFGIGDSPSGLSICADEIPLVLQWRGVRYNCQVETAQDQFSNLQSFLTVLGDLDPEPPAPGAPSPGASRYSGPRRSLEEISPAADENEIRRLFPPRRRWR